MITILQWIPSCTCREEWRILSIPWFYAHPIIVWCHSIIILHWASSYSSISVHIMHRLWLGGHQVLEYFPGVNLRAAVCGHFKDYSGWTNWCNYWTLECDWARVCQTCRPGVPSSYYACILARMRHIYTVPIRTTRIYTHLILWVELMEAGGELCC